MVPLLLTAIVVGLAASPARANLVLNYTDFTGWTTGGWHSGSANDGSVTIHGNGSITMATHASSGGVSRAYAYDPNSAISSPLAGASVSVTLNVGTGAIQQFDLLLEQNGSLFVDQIGPISAGAGSKTLTQTGLTAFDFLEIVGSATLDLTGNTPTEVGFAVSNASSAVTRTFSSLSVQAVPEPTSLVLFAPALFGLLALRRRKAVPRQAT